MLGVIKKIQNSKKMNLDNFDELYEIYMNTTQCNTCPRVLAQGKSRIKCMDHNHTTTYPREVCCNKCNFALRHTDLMFKLTMLELKSRFKKVSVFFKINSV